MRKINQLDPSFHSFRRYTGLWQTDGQTHDNSNSALAQRRAVIRVSTVIRLGVAR